MFIENPLPYDWKDVYCIEKSLVFENLPKSDPLYLPPNPLDPYLVGPPPRLSSELPLIDP